MTGKVVSCDVDAYYSVLGAKEYSYFVDFEIQGNKKEVPPCHRYTQRLILFGW